MCVCVCVFSNSLRIFIAFIFYVEQKMFIVDSEIGWLHYLRVIYISFFFILLLKLIRSLSFSHKVIFRTWEVFNSKRMLLMCVVCSVYCGACAWVKLRANSSTKILVSHAHQYTEHWNNYTSDEWEANQPQSVSQPAYRESESIFDIFNVDEIALTLSYACNIAERKKMKKKKSKTVLL